MNNPEKIAQRLEENKKKAREQGRYAYYRHGVTLDERRAIEESQNWRCPLCGVDLRETPKPSIDHNHTSGAIRGILCGKCNAGLGWFETKREAVELYLASPPVHPGRPDRPGRR